MQVALAAPAEDVRVTLARAFAAAVEEEDAVPCFTSMRVCFCGPERPGKAITVAPLREGMNHPWSRSPSLVVKETFSGVAPRFGRSRSGSIHQEPS